MVFPKHQGGCCITSADLASGTLTAAIVYSFKQVISSDPKRKGTDPISQWEEGHGISRNNSWDKICCWIIFGKGNMSHKVIITRFSYMVSEAPLWWLTSCPFGAWSWWAQLNWTHQLLLLRVCWCGHLSVFNTFSSSICESANSLNWGHLWKDKDIYTNVLS